MNEVIKGIYKKENDLWGYPQIYKGIEFHPLKVDNSVYQNLFRQIFFQPKSFINDPNIVKLSYMRFIVLIDSSFSTPDSENNILVKIKKFLSFITNKEVEIELVHVSNIDNYFIIKIGNTVFIEDEFENIREIVLEQNGINVDYIEEYNPELERKLLFHTREDNLLTFEDEVFVYCALTNKSVVDVRQFTLYQFKKQFERVLILKNFDLYKPLEVSGQIKMKDGSEIKHFFSPIGEGGRYDSIKIDVNKYLSDNKELLKT